MSLLEACLLRSSRVGFVRICSSPDGCRDELGQNLLRLGLCEIERWVDPEAYRHNLRRFAEVGRRHGIRVLFVSQALRPIEMGENAPWSSRGSQEDNAKIYALLGVKDLEDLHRLDQSYRDLLYEVADQEGVPVADASAAFAGSREPLFGQYDFIHCNVAGARVIAETIRQKLFELGWLGSTARPPTERSQGDAPPQY
jgi:lysophospholipase L1-like esterase